MSSSSLLQRLLDPYRGLSDSGIGQMDLKETKEAYIFIFDLPGQSKDGVAVTLQVREGVGSVLQVTAQGNDQEEEDEVKTEDSNVKWHCRERIRPCGGFSEQIRLPENVNVGAITANMRDGVLTVTVPKRGEEKKGHDKRSSRRAVAIGGGGDGDGRPQAAKGLGRFVCCKA